MNKFLKFLFIFFAVGVGLYPVLYFILDMSQGLLNTKQPDQLASDTWQFFFKIHIIFGGVSLLVGWSQFIPKWRNRKLTFHRLLGKIYVVAVLIGGLTGLYLATGATGGFLSAFGFGGLAISWLITTGMALYHIRNRNILQHEIWMIRSYALTFAAVSLRLLLPVVPALTGLSFIPAYQIISWLCWIPNLFIAEWLIRRNKLAFS